MDWDGQKGGKSSKASAFWLQKAFGLTSQRCKYGTLACAAFQLQMPTELSLLKGSNLRGWLLSFSHLGKTCQDSGFFAVRLLRRSLLMPLAPPSSGKSGELPSQASCHACGA